MIRIKRVYETPDAKDGFRILVDRLWPRGLSKKKAAIGLWLGEAAPSSRLRAWFSHQPEKWPAFRKKYAQELRAREELLSQIRRAEREHGTVTLLYGARDARRNNAVALQNYLRRRKRS